VISGALDRPPWRCHRGRVLPRTVANSVDDYYLGHGEAPGRWIGATAEQLGLTGEVNADQLRNLLAGLSPKACRSACSSAPIAVPATTFTFSARRGSRSVAFSSDQIRFRDHEAHDRAVVADSTAGRRLLCRRGANGQTLTEANGSSGPPSGTGQPGRRPPTPHHVSSQPGPGSRRPVVSPRRPPPLRLEEDGRHPLPVGTPVRAGPPGLAWEVAATASPSWPT